jgi:hypothetical protein
MGEGQNRRDIVTPRYLRRWTRWHWALVAVFTATLLASPLRRSVDEPAATQAQGIDQGQRVFLALVANQVPRASLQRPAPQAPATEPATPNPMPTTEPTATSGPAPVPTLRACQATLDKRVFARPLAIEGGRTVQQPQGRGWWTHYPMITAPIDDSVAWVGWSAEQEVRYTPVLGLGRRAGADYVYPRAESTHGGLAHADGGGAALVRHGRVMSLVRWEADGSQRFDTELVGTSGSGGRHQGDLLWLIDGEGRLLDEAAREQSRHPWWDWGCSHSIDLRLILHPTLQRLGSVCLSDAYPSPGFVFERGLLINPEPSADGNGSVDALLGGLAPAEEGFALTYVSREGRRSHDVALRRIYDEENDIGPPWWLTETPDIDESSAHLARYGDDLLAGWTAGGRLHLAVVSQRGKFLEGPVVVDAEIAARDDFVVYPNGDVGWTFSRGARDALWSARVQLCRRTADSP